MRGIGLALLGAALLPLPAVANTGANSGDLNLVCRGKASRDESSKPSLPWDTKREKRVDYEEAVYLRLRSDNTGEAQLPKKMQSAYKESKDGWFPLLDVNRKDNEVNGRVRLHSMYKPKFRIDRITGLLTIYGDLGDFAGECVSFDPAAVTRKF